MAFTFPAEDAMRTAFATLILLSVVAAADTQAQAGVAGTYLVDYDAQLQMGPDGPQVTGRGKARMVLEIRGDSVFGSWQTVDAAQQRPPRKLAGTFKDGTLKLVAEPVESVMNINGEEQRRSIVQTFTGTVKGDDIAGTIESASPMPNMPPLTRKFDGKREASK